MGDLTAARLAEQLTATFLQVVVDGEPRLARSLEILEPGSTVPVESGDLVLGIGVNTAQDARAVARRSRASAGLVLRHDVAEAAAGVCRELGLTLMRLAERTSWSALAQVIRGALEPSGVLPDDSASYQDLFTLADTLSELLQAPITIEDPGSRVLAWSSNQPDVDGARTATIIGRRVPQQVRDRYRARGVFRRLASSDEAVMVAADAETHARWILPIRAGGEWLGSIWAAVPRDAPPARAEQARLLADVVALHLLRMRARTDLHRQVEVEQVRALLRGTTREAPEWLTQSSWVVAVLNGPEATGAELAATVRQQVWAATLRRHGWARPLLADLDGDVLALTQPGVGRPGTLGWLEDVVRAEHQRNGALWATTSLPAEDPSELPGCVERATEQARLGRAVAGPFSTTLDCWSALHLARMARVPVGDLPSPVRDLWHATDGPLLVRTLTEVLRHWGDPQAAARALEVHVNTVRNRMARITALSSLQLQDPAQRLSAWFECERLA